MADKAKGKGVDDPEFVNAFLAMIGGAPVPKSHFKRPAPVVKSQLAAEHAEPQSVAEKEQAASENLSDNDTTPSKTPPTGLNAPPTTPATPAVTGEKLKALELDSVDENDPVILFANIADPNSTLADSKYAPKQRVYNPYGNMPTPARGQETGSFDRLRLDRPAPEFTRTQVQQDVLNRIAQRKGPSTPPAASTKQHVVVKTSPPMGTSFENDVAAQSKTHFEGSERNKENVKITKNNIGTLEVKNTEPFPPFGDCSDGLAIKSPPAPSTIASMTDGILSVATTGDSLSPDAIEFIPSSPAAVQSKVKEVNEQTVAGVVNTAQAVLNSAKAELAEKTGRLSISQKEPGSPEASAIVVTANEDPLDRENTTNFVSWGAPQARNTAPAKVRKIIFRGLPVAADLTLVQSLVHGGAIDTYALGVNGTASVTFTTSEACSAYYATYPNGMTFKYKGKSYVVYVDKGKDVNMVSGMLRGHLECGASRCVRATGADGDLGMKALLKLAEGKTRNGKVEHISDVWRNQIRTIIFRFTSISDAVAFKAMLTRHSDWEGCNIQFMDDPCEKATAVHIE